MNSQQHMNYPLIYAPQTTGERQALSISEFLLQIADIIEADTQKLSRESDFREEADFWSSLVGFALLTFLEDQCDTVLSIDEFIECQTVGDLYSKVSPPKR
jgi:acyl carrier protein